MATSANLPPGLKLTLGQRIDRRLALIVGSSLLVHGAIATYAWLGDPAEPAFGQAVTYQQDMIDVTVPDVLVLPALPGAATPVTSKQTPQPIVRPKHAPKITNEPVDSQRLAAILTGTDGEVGKTGMNPRQPDFDLGKQIAAARDSNVPISDTGPRIDTPRIGTRDPSIVDDPTLTRLPTTPRDEPGGRIISGQIRPDRTTSLTPASVLDRINTVYMAGLQRCYRLGLADEATLAGRVAISFTVDERGKVTDADASGVSPLVDGCISKQMTGWRFAIPKHADGTTTDASFAVSLALQPS